MAWSKAPEALTALYNAVSAGVTDAAVHDGPVVTATSMLDAFVIGYESDTAPAVEHEMSVANAGLASSRERFTLHVKIVSINTSVNIVAARTRVYEMLGQLAQILEADPKLAGTVMIAQISEAILTQSQSKSGAVATLVVAIACDAFTAS